MKHDNQAVEIIKTLNTIRRSSRKVTLTWSNWEVSEFSESSKLRRPSKLTRRKEIAGIHTQYMYNPFLQADYLDKQGRAILEGLEHVTGRYRVQLSIPSSNSQSTKEPEVALWYDVKRRMLGYEKLSSAFLIYRQLLYTTEWYWSRRSLEYCWVANRLGRVLEIFGMRTEALDLYIRAAEGRHTLLGAEHRKTKESQERAERLLR